LLPIGLSTTPEFGLTATTEPALTGITRNPWNLDHSTGGSSGGSAALVAAGVVPIAHANDGGGSIRIPAASCGLVGLKPSRGRIAKEPDPKLMPVDFTIDGVVTRTVRDTAAFMYGAEQFGPAPGLAPVGNVTDPLDRPLRVGVIDQRMDGVRYDSANRAAIAEAAATMEGLGHEVDVIPNPFPVQYIDDFILLWSMIPFAMWHAGARVMGEGWDRDQLEPWSKWLVRHFRRNSAKAPTAFRRLRKFAAGGYSATFRDYDVLLSSTLASPVPEIGYLDPAIDGDVHYERLLSHVPTTPIQNVGGGPAITLPMAQDDDGLPLGLHFAADIGQEALLLALALQLEESDPWPTLASN
jgi:amidase